MEEKEPIYDITDMAEWFLTKEPMTHKKLQKLCYFAVAWNWGINQEPLCKNCEFEAWIHGSVNRILYQKYKQNGWHKIKKEEQNKIQDEDIKNLLESIWNSLGEFTGEQLEFLNHEDEAYKKARGCIDKLDPCTDIIQKEDMIKYYGDLFEKGQND